LGEVTIKAYVPDAELADLYARAAVFAFLSEYEGFGLTPLEALAAGVPIVVLDTPVAREVYGDAAHYVALGDVRGAADVLTRLLQNPQSAASTLEQAPAVLARYSWDRCAAATLDAIEQLVHRS
jgi:alpha-1,3-rhamnosyl/mannosyltransferase